MKELTRKEILQVAKEIDALDVWEQYTKCAIDNYGPTAYKVTVITDYQYNDEGGSTVIVGQIEVRDKDDKLLDCENDIYDLIYDLPRPNDYWDYETVFIIDNPPKLTYSKVFAEQ